MNLETANDIVIAIADVLEMTGQIRAMRKHTQGGRVAIALFPVGAARGRHVSIAVDNIGPIAFTVAPIENERIVDEQVEMTSSIPMLPPLLSRAFSWARTVRKNRRTSRRRASR